MNKDNEQPTTPPPSPSSAPLADTSGDWSDSELNGNDENGSGNESDVIGNGSEGQLAEDDPITSLAYLQKFGVSANVSERQNAVRNIVKTLQNVEHDDAAAQVVFSMVSKSFSEDGDAVVRGELLEQLPMICMHCSQTPALSKYTREVLYPLLVKFLNDPNTQVRKTCQAAILILIEQGLLMPEDIIEWIYPELMKLSGVGFPDDVRIEAVCLLCKLVSTLGRETTIKLFLDRFKELCQDQLFHVRKTCASHLGEMSRVLGQDVTEKLLVPHLISLSQDSVWGVRKTCAECFTDISYNCAMQTRRHQLAPVFIVLLADNSRWVQCSAFQALGPFISTFADSSRTGLKWVEGELVYDEPRNNEHMQHSNNYLSNAATSADQPLSLHNPSSTAGDDDDDDDDTGINLKSFQPFLDERGSSSSAITSNVAQLVKQRLNGDIGGTDPAPCIVDLSASILPPVDNSEQQEGGQESSGESTKKTEPGAEFSSNQWWKIHYSAFTPPEVWLKVFPEEGPDPPHKDESESGANAKVGDEDPNFQKFMERRLGVGAAAIGSSEGSTETKPTVEDRKEKDEGTKDNGKTAEKKPVEHEDIQKHRKRSNSTEYISFAAQGHGDPNASPDVSPKGFEYQDIIPQALLDQFLSMVEPSRAQSIESDISRHCAFNLPAVAFTIGRKHWPLIKPTYLALANDMQWKVRRTLAFSIHELAAILGPDLTVQDLLPVFSGFLRDLDEVRIGILRHLYDFLKLFQLLHKDVRRSLLPSLADFLQTDNYRSWRFRHLFAEQLILLCDLFDIEDINDYLSPIAMTLAIDKISEIRQVTHRLLAAILGCFYKVEAAKSDICDITDSFVQDIVKSFAKSQRWVRRQTFVYVCREVVRSFAVPESKFANELLPALLSLAQDNIPNVRIALAALFAEMYYMHAAYLSDPELVKQVSNAIKRLANDRDRDVRLNATGGTDSEQMRDVDSDDQTVEEGRDASDSW